MITDLLPGEAPVIRYDFKRQPFLKMDLSGENEALKHVDLNDEKSFTNFIFDQLETAKVPFGVGGYAERRLLYSRSDLFTGEEQRTVHLGIDIWGKAGTPVYAPLDGIVHSFANNAVHGDYGPVIILKHIIEGFEIHSLYGHLSKSSLNGLFEGKEFKAGQQVGQFGIYGENFHWPPHIHFQLIRDMQGYRGDYPGVCKESERNFYLNNCPDPSLMLKL